MGLTSFLREAADCYERDPDSAWVALETADTQSGGQNGIIPRIGPKGEKEARTKSRVRTAKEMRRRLLEFSRDGVLPSEGIIAESKSVSSSALRKPFDYALWKKERIEAFIEHVIEVANHDGSLITKKELLQSYTPEEILTLENDNHFKILEREYELFQLSKPDFEAYLVQRMLSRIESVSECVERTSPVAFRQEIPEHLRKLIYEAQWCDLYELHAACAALCGAILQEAIRFQLEAKGFSGLSEAIDDATKAGLFTSKASEAADQILEARNLAAHGNEGFLEMSETQKALVLPNMRLALDSIFSARI